MPAAAAIVRTAEIGADRHHLLRCRRLQCPDEAFRYPARANDAPTQAGHVEGMGGGGRGQHDGELVQGHVTCPLSGGRRPGAHVLASGGVDMHLCADSVQQQALPGQYVLTFDAVVSAFSPGAAMTRTAVHPRRVMPCTWEVETVV